MTPHADLPFLPAEGSNIVLFYPHVSEAARRRVYEQLGTRWIGQGPAVKQFEQEFSVRFCDGRPAVAVGAGTDALHLAYLLAGIGPGDEVVTPVFTCAATNIPLRYIGAKAVFADIQADTMNIDPDDVRRRVTARTKAIVCVHYGGLPCDMDELQAIADEHGIPVIEDAAHAIGATYRGRSIGTLSDFTIFSFQAIKQLTTGDGGMLVLRPDRSVVAAAERLRWFGIDREGKFGGHWENDITEVGYKYQMTDIAAALGLAVLDEWDGVMAQRQRLFTIYERGLDGIDGITMLGRPGEDRTHAAWLCTVGVDRRTDLQQKLRAAGIESNQVHFRNDRYSIFAESRDSYPVMDAMDDRYLVLPLHTHMSDADAERVVATIRSGW